MKIKIQTQKLDDGGWLAQADTSLNFGVGFPGAVKYGDTETEAHDRLKTLLEGKGYKIVEVSNMRNWLDHLDVCRLQRRGQCPNHCADGQHLWSRAHEANVAGN